MLGHYRLFSLDYTATTAIYTLSLHDALPILALKDALMLLLLPTATLPKLNAEGLTAKFPAVLPVPDTRSEETRLNSSHLGISYAVFCLKKKKTAKRQRDCERQAERAHEGNPQPSTTVRTDLVSAHHARSLPSFFS